MEKKKICFIASSGGHLQEISFVSALAEEYDCFLVTEKSEFQTQYHLEKTYFVNKIDRREKHFLLHFIGLIFRSAKLLHKEKPDVILSTGALAAVPMLYLGRLTGRTIVFIESFARVEGPSLTGRLVYPIAHLFIVQWEQLLKVYPRAVYASRLFGREAAQ